MDLSKLAATLGLPKESTESVVFEALAKRDAEGRAAVESLSAVAAELPKHGFKLEAGKLVGPPAAPVRLDLAAKAEDDEEKKALKAALLAAEEKSIATGLSSNKEYVKKLAADLKLPPAAMSIVEECLSVRGEMEALALSKDGKVEVRKTQDLPKKLRTLLDQLVGMKGVKFSTENESPKTEADAEKAAREKAFKEHFSKHVEEVPAAK
jgi:hypothetical protein